VDFKQIIRAALAEDLIGGRDVTSKSFLTEQDIGAGWIEAREQGVVSGLEVATAVFREVDSSLDVTALCADGARFDTGEHVLRISGKAASIVAAERTALNFLCHLSGIATLTNRFVTLTKPYGTKILCTRKTTPGLRMLEVAAVRNGGGECYRTDLSSSVLVKDNHIGIAGGFAGIRSRLSSLQARHPDQAKQVLQDGKIEVSSLEDLEIAVEMGWKQILLDNFEVAAVREAVKLWGNSVFLEVSGGVTQSNLVDYAAMGVHAISVGALTHSVSAMDFSLEVEWSRK
jgi:nicotinate-nucleotide pyrophosphorylase (carboxylating)